MNVTPIEFETIVLDAFHYLISDFGFRCLSTNMHAPECWTAFHSVTTAVIVHFELGSQPWVELAELKREGDQIVERNRAALEFLVRERAPQEASLRARDDSDEEVRRVIYEKARQLREYGKDVLSGDFRVFPRLKELAAENLRKRNAAEK
jgi:hypothetical protein